MQRYTIFFIAVNALHVSGGFSAHHREFKTVHTASGIHGLSGKFTKVQNSPPLRRRSGARQVLLSSNELDELRRENRIALSCLVTVLCFFM
jgi:hypothetical protein